MATRRGLLLCRGTVVEDRWQSVIPRVDTRDGCPPVIAPPEMEGRTGVATPIERRVVSRSLDALEVAAGLAWVAVQRRTWAVAECVADGATWAEIADRLDVAVSSLRRDFLCEVQEIVALLDD